MALAGRLEVVEIPNLLQVLCLERRQVAILIQCGGRRGTVFLEDGEIVHATTGNLVGEAAAFEILGWHTGDFRVLESTPVPQRTIRSSPSNLLIEAARKEEARSATAAPEVPTREDEQWLKTLLALLSELEQDVSKLSSRRIRRRPARGLSHLEVLLNRVEDFAEKHGLWPGGSRLDLRVRLMDDFSPLLHLAVMEDARLQLDSAVKLYSAWKDRKAERSRAYSLLCESLADALEGQLTELAIRFQGETLRNEWDDAAGVLIRQVRDALLKIPF